MLEGQEGKLAQGPGREAMGNSDIPSQESFNMGILSGFPGVCGGCRDHAGPLVRTIKVSSLTDDLIDP